MSYTPTDWDIGDVITAEKMNKLEQAVAGGGGYDLVLTVPQHDQSAANVEVVSGDILECEQKIADGEPVNAVLVGTNEWSYTPSGVNAPNVSWVAHLTHWNCPYCAMTFSCMMGNGTNHSGFRVSVYNVEYDPDDGSILAISNPYQDF